jgi:predicted TIM-barrel fold metal-dependent hydrolase
MLAACRDCTRPRGSLGVRPARRKRRVARAAGEEGLGVEPIIDAHTHLGDILEPDGGSLIGQTGVEKAPIFDLVTLAERRLHRDPLGLGGVLYALMRRWVTRAERARNRTATLENFRRSMRESGIAHSVCLPLPPYVRFADLRPVAEKEARVIPFTGADYAESADPDTALAADVAAGARGLKLHPIIQNRPLGSAQTRAFVEAFSPHDLPVLFHCGVSQYYLGADRVREQPRYGEIHYAAELVEAFPRVNFIAGHAGLFQVRDVIGMLGRYRNVWVETSFQSVATVRQLIATFGPERVLFGSDWPFGNRPPALAIARRACRGDRGLERRILFENAAELLRLD